MTRTVFQLAVFCLAGCIAENNNDSTDIQSHYEYYEDMDLFHMRGIDEISPGDDNGRYVRIDSIGENHMDVVFHFDKRTVYKRSYKYDGHCWASSHKVDDREEGAIFYFYEFIYADSILELEYKNDPFHDGILQTVRKVERGKILEYDLQDDIKLPPSRLIDTYPLEKFFRKRIMSYHIKNGILSINTQLVDGDSKKTIRQSDDCYVIGTLSFFWWSFAGHRMDKIECY